MEHRRIGALDVSVVGLGCNNFGRRTDAERTRAVVDAAIGAGINYFDTAEMYSDGMSEELLGRAVGSRRTEVVIATKWGWWNDAADSEGAAAPAEIRAALERSLRRLGTDYVDHYQLHRPDRATPTAETLGCLAELRDEGKIREIGCTSFSAAELAESHRAAVEAGLHPFASVQNHYSVLTRDVESDGVFATCEQLGIAFVPFFPLESGTLTGKYRRGEEPPPGSRLSSWRTQGSRFIDDQRLEVVERLERWAASRDRSLLELAMSWHTSHPLIASVIAGATRPEQVLSNVAAAGWKLTADDRAEVDTIMAS